MDTQLKDEFPIKVAEPIADWHLPERELLARPETTVLRIIAWVFFFTGFVFFLFVRDSVQTEVTFTVATTEALLLMFISQAVLVYMYRKSANHVEVGSGFTRLQSKVPENVDLPVQIEIVRQGCTTGKDRGYVWLHEGTWYFKGLQTAFRFNQQDVVPVEAWPGTIQPDPVRDKPARVLPMKSKHGPFQLRIDVLDPYEDYAKRKRVKAFYREMYDWLYERPRGTIESLLPPSSVHPSLVRRDVGKFEGLVGAAFFVVFDMAVLFGLPRGGLATNLGNFGVVVGIGVSVMLFFAMRFAWHEYRDLSIRSRMSQDSSEPM